jgi:hypothetical protein
MALQYGVALRTAQAGAIETAIGTSPVLTLRSGAPPANCATADSGTLIATLNLPSDWLAAAASGAVSKTGTWEDLSADNAGTVGHFRIKTSGAVCEIQGTVTTTAAGTGDMLLDNTVVTAGQAITITSFTITRGNS